MDSAKKQRYKSAELEAQIEAYERAYNAFRYTDEQRERTIKFIEQAMKVLRGDAQFGSLGRLLNVLSAQEVIRMGVSARGGNQYNFDARPLSPWTKIYVLGTANPARSEEVEPYHLQVNFSPPMVIDRERLEALLDLKVVSGWTGDGGNLRPPGFNIHTGQPDNAGDFVYAPLRQPSGPYNIEINLNYLLNDVDRNPYSAKELTTLEITRRYLSPEQLKQRDTQRLGHLPYTGDICATAGRYVPVLLHDPNNWLAHRPWDTSGFDVGDRFPQFGYLNTKTDESERIPVWWRWVAPDPWLEQYGKRARNQPPA